MIKVKESLGAFGNVSAVCVFCFFFHLVLSGKNTRLINERVQALVLMVVLVPPLQDLWLPSPLH